MANRSRAARVDIFAFLRRHLGQRTVLGIAIPVLSGHVDSMKRGTPFRGVTERQIEAGFRELSSRFVRSEYHSTYLHRALARFLRVSDRRYRFREELLANAPLAELVALRQELLDSLRTAYEKRQAVIAKLVAACALPTEEIEERYALIDSYLKQLSGNRGEMFEVVSFAVLREYFRTFGFSLQRFSTTHANDGGMDFVGGEAIYQVTTDESLQKIRRDLAKAPGTKRVLVRPSLAASGADLEQENVLEVIELKDILSHFILWLMSRDRGSKQARHLQRVLEIALTEFRRENRAETEAGMQPA